MTIETEVANLTAQTTALLSAVNVSKGTLDQRVTDATTQAVLAEVRAGNAASSATAASASATAAAGSAASALAIYGNTSAQQAAQATAAAQSALAVSSAAQAAAAKDLAITAWAASTAPAETMAAISKTVHSGAVVKAFYYDTSKDSDSGAWRKRCQDKSWFTEPLGFTGTWRNQLATTAAAWAVSGAAAGDGFQNTTDGKFYVLSGTNAATEIFRGNVREFPATALVIIETGRVVMYDATQPGCPMWMVFVANGSSNWYGSTQTLTACVASHGRILVGSSSGLREINFIGDAFTLGHPSLNFSPSGGISTRHSTANWSDSRVYRIVNILVNDVAVTVLDNAPIDYFTGLPVPTVAVATAGGVSVIKDDDGTVVNDTSVRASAIATTVAFNSQNKIVRNWNDGHRIGVAKVQFPTSVADYNLYDTVNANGVAPQFPFGGNGVKIASNGAISNTNGCVLVKDNPADRVKTILATITNTYNTGWQVGDSRLCTLADTVAETVTGSGQLISNSTFDTDVSGWSPVGASNTISWNAGKLRVTGDGTAYVAAGTSFPTVVGKTYTLEIVGTPGSVTGAGVRANIDSGVFGGASITNGAASSSAPFSFVAASSTTYISVRNNSATAEYIEVDSVSVKLATPDRSVKNIGLILNGTLTKTAVAVGAALVSYSGWSATNYLQQPYTAALDFGTSEWSDGAWVSYTTAVVSTIADRSAASGPSVKFGTDASGKFIATVFDGTTTRTATSALAYNTGVFLKARAIYTTDGRLSINVNGKEVGFATGSPLLTLTNTAAVLTVGNSRTLDAPFPGSVALLKTSATAPSVEQLAFIYNAELAMFQPGAQCAIDGTSTAVTALAYDDSTDILHVGTSWGRSAIKGLVRVESAVSVVGAITSIAAGQGATFTGGATSGRFYQPAMLLRDELRRKDEAKRALGKMPVFFEFDTASFTSPTTSGSTALTASSVVGTPYVGMGITGTGIPAGTTIVAISGAAHTMSAAATVTNAGAVTLAQNGFALQQGFTAKAVYSAGVLKRQGATKDYLVANDGFRETVNFGVSPGSAAWVSIMAVRSN